MHSIRLENEINTSIYRSVSYQTQVCKFYLCNSMNNHSNRFVPIVRQCYFLSHFVDLSIRKVWASNRTKNRDTRFSQNI